MNIKKKDLNILLINADRIYHYRNDVLSERDLSKLKEARYRLKELLANFKSIKECW